MAHSLQDRYSALVDAKLRASIVQKDGVVWNNRYDGSPKAGAVKIPIRDTEVTVSDYNKTTGAAKSHGSTAYLTVAINKDKSVNEVIDGYDAAAVPDNLIADRVDSAGYSLSLQINSDSTAALIAGGLGFGTAAALTKTTVYDVFVDARKALSVNKIPTDGRWALVTPETYSLLLKSPEFIKASALGDAVVQTGAIGSIAGFTVYEDVTLPDGVDFIVGHAGWCTRVHEWAVDVHVQDLAGSGDYIGACAVQGRKIYAHCVTKEKAVLYKSTVAAPTVTISSHSCSVTASGAESIAYRKNGGAWQTYSAAVATVANDVIEAYAVSASGVKSAVVSETDS